MPEKNKPRYATTADPLIAAVIAEMFRFSSEQQSDERLEQLRALYITTKVTPEDAENQLTLWIKDYALSDEDKDAGYLGHYALIKTKKIEGKFSLAAAKLVMPLKNHPQRKLVKQRVANWGFPLLRSVKAKKQHFKTMEDAQAFLLKLHGEFPETSIPNPGKLYIMIYSKETKPAVQKHVLEIVAAPTGGFSIDWKVNGYKGSKTPLHVMADPAMDTLDEQSSEPGRFASQELVRKAKRAAKTKPPAPTKRLLKKPE